MQLSNSALEHLFVNDCIIMSRCCLQKLREHKGRRYFFFFSLFCICMYTHIQQSREIVLEEKYGAMPQYLGIINMYMSTAIHYT